MAVIKLDNITVAQTSWKPCSQQAWDQRFSIDLDRSRELEIGIYWRDWRSMCAVKFLRWRTSSTTFGTAWHYNWNRKACSLLRLNS